MVEEKDRTYKDQWEDLDKQMSWTWKTSNAMENEVEVVTVHNEKVTTNSPSSMGNLPKDVKVGQGNAVHFTQNGACTDEDIHWFWYTDEQAAQVKNMIDAYVIESEKNVMYVKAIKSYLTRESTLLRFNEGDVIKLTDKDMTLDKGWLYGSLYGRTGLFPGEYVKPMARHELEKSEGGGKPVPPSPPPPAQVSPAPPPPPQHKQHKHLAHYAPSPRREEIYSDASIYSLMPDVQKYSMMEFAMLHFRQSPFSQGRPKARGSGGVPNWTWKEQADMVKWNKSPIQASLLNFESPQMNKMALECFIAIMRYMGDYPLGRGQKPVDCVYTLLRACYNHPELRDEVYCQLAKQTTSNRSTRQESLQQGWRLFSIVTCYFECTDVLEPYLYKYLEGTAYDNQRPHQAVAAQSLQNLRSTFKYGGRKNVPSRVELEALTRGRNTKRQMCIMPGGLPVVLNVRSCSVVQDAIDQICARLDIHKSAEKEEFTVFYVLQTESRYCTLSRGEYLFDITTELTNQKKEFYLLFQRTSWVYPLHFDYNALYIDVMYHQCIPDYHDGFLLPVPTSTLKDYIKTELSLLAALQLRATETVGTPTQKDILAVVPKTLHSQFGTNWTTLVEEKMKKLQSMTPQQAKIYFLETLSRWPLFGSTFFNVKSVTEQQVKGESLLAINKAGVHFLHPNTHETQLSYPFSEVISTRRFHGDKGRLFLDMKVGDLMHQKVTRIETDQGGDISALIGQYIHILKKSKN